MKERIKEIKEWIEKNKVKTIVVTIIVVAIIISVTTAVFYTSGSGTNKKITMGTLKVTYIDGQTINGSNALPLEEDEVEEYASKTSFQVANSGNLTGYAEISLIISNLPNELNSEDFRWTLYREGQAIKEGSFKGAGSKLVLAKDEVIYPNSTGINYKIAVWIRENGGDQNNLLNKTVTAKINIKASDKRGEYAEYGVNPPELVDGLIPVTYDEAKGSWVKANVNKRWYSYNDQEWANAVTVTYSSRSNYESAKPGTVISMDDINSMWVWIPRYKYKIPSNMGSNEYINSPQIDVVFESGLNTTGVDEATYRSGIASDGTNSNYYTHPAFRNGSKVYNITPYDIGGWDKELTGIWVGKFKTGTDNNTCNTTPSENNCKTVNPIIKPDVLSLRNQNISTQFVTSLKFAGGTMDTSTGKVTYSGNNTYGLTSSVDTHMMKNIEWGAVAYLSQSQYGKKGNSNYMVGNRIIERNNSSGYYTGRSGSGPITVYGSYSYNDKTCTTTTSSCTGSKISHAGQGASTTGTIYGIYDMRGLPSERIMGNWNGYSGNKISPSGFNGPDQDDNSSITTGISFPEKKYYDLYTGESSNTITKEKSILGDASWETLHWDDNYGSFINEDAVWSLVSNPYGLFSMSNSHGESDSSVSFRSVLIP